MNYRQNRRAGDEPEGNRSEQDEFLHGDLLQAGAPPAGTCKPYSARPVVSL
jgi:hypothetical protein